MRNELYHHGIKGMKWGVRHSRKHQKTRADAPRASDHEDYKRAHSGRSVRSMSDQELRTINNRLQMERQYKSLTSPELSEGQKWLRRLIAGAATSIAMSYLVKGTNSVVDAVVQTGKDLVNEKKGSKNT